MGVCFISYNNVMSFRYYNPNPERSDVGDCVIRAICRITGRSWRDVYAGIAAQGYFDYDMPSGNAVWGEYLQKHGFRRRVAPDTCPVCYTVKDFCEDHPSGEYIVATGTHVVAVVDGDYYDTWDSGDKIVEYFWTKETGHGL